jgi:hypothetical protein
MTVTFTAQMEKFADLTKRKMELVFKQSAQDVFEAAQKPKAQGGNLPVDTGYLRNTFVAGANGATNLSGADAYVLAIAGADLGDSVFGGWTAAYALRMEYGFVGTDSRGRTYNQAGNFFALSAAQQWSAIIARNVAKAQALRG